MVVSRSGLSFWMVSVYRAWCEPSSSSVQAAGATITYVTLCTCCVGLVSAVGKNKVWKVSSSPQCSGYARSPEALGGYVRTQRVVGRLRDMVNESHVAVWQLPLPTDGGCNMVSVQYKGVFCAEVLNP